MHFRLAHVGIRAGRNAVHLSFRLVWAGRCGPEKGPERRQHNHCQDPKTAGTPVAQRARKPLPCRACVAKDQASTTNVVRFVGQNNDLNREISGV